MRKAMRRAMQEIEALHLEEQDFDVLDHIEAIEFNKAREAHEEKHWCEYVRLHCPRVRDEDVPRLVARCKRVARHISFFARETAMHRLFDDYNNQGPPQ